MLDPVSDAPAATVDAAGERLLVVADYHAGIEAGLRYERGVELSSAATTRRERLLGLVDRTGADRVVVVGDLVHRVGAPGDADLSELRALVDALADRAPLTLVAGNHDAGVADAVDSIDVRPPDGWRAGAVAFAHGHAWPDQSLLSADTLCVGHEHPAVRLTDDVGGARTERAWLRGALRPEPFAEQAGVSPDALDWGAPEVVVVPAFNDRSGGTWVNEQSFLSPFLPDALADGATAYLLDGTRLGDYRRV